MTKYPIYIPSKGRSENCFTADILIEQDIPFNLVVEPQDADQYIDEYGNEKCLVIDENNQGVSYVRNWIKKYSIDNQDFFHWQIDDNVRSFRIRRNNKNEKCYATRCLCEVECEVDKYQNIALAGLTYTTFAFSYNKDIGINKQQASCVLVRNDIPIWWRDNIAEDTDYSLQLLYTGKWATMQFHRLLIDKIQTMNMRGGVYRNRIS